MKYRALLLTCVTVAVAIGIRWGFVIESRHFPDFRTFTPGMDVDVHWNAARLLESTHPQNTAFELAVLSAPVNMAFLSLTQKTLGENVISHRFLYAGLGGCIAAMVYGFAFRLSNDLRIATSSALLFSLEPSWVFATTIPLKTTLTVGFGVTMLWSAYECIETNSRMARLCLGVAQFFFAWMLFHTQRNTLVLSAGALVFTVAAQKAGCGRRGPLVVALALALTCFALCASIYTKPWTSYPQVGIHLRVGNHPGATGTYSPIPGIPPTPVGHTFVARMAAEIAEDRPMSPREADRHHLGRALTWARDNPRDFARLSARKILLFVNDHAPNENYYLAELKTRSAVLRTVPITFGVLIVLGSIGIFSLARHHQWKIVVLLGGAVASTLAVNVVSFVTSRYRVSALAPLAILAGFGLVIAYDQLRMALAERKMSRAAILIPGAFAVLLAYAPVVSHQEIESSMVTAAGNLNRSRSAEQTADRLASLELATPRSKQMEKERAFLLLRLQRLTEAYRAFETLAESPDADAQILRQYLAMAVVAGDYDLAATICARCRREFGWTRRDILSGHEDSVRAVLERFVLPKVEDEG